MEETQMMSTKTGNYLIDNGFSNYNDDASWDDLVVNEWVFDILPKHVQVDQPHAKGYLFSLLSKTRLPDTFIEKHISMLEAIDVYEANYTSASPSALSKIINALVVEDFHDAMHEDFDFDRTTSLLMGPDLNNVGKNFVLKSLIKTLVMMGESFTNNKIFMHHKVTEEMVMAFHSKVEAFLNAFIDIAEKETLEEAVENKIMLPEYIYIELGDMDFRKDVKVENIDANVEFLSLYISNGLAGDDVAKENRALSLLKETLNII